MYWGGELETEVEAKAERPGGGQLRDLETRHQGTAIQRLRFRVDVRYLGPQRHVVSGKRYAQGTEPDARYESLGKLVAEAHLPQFYERSVETVGLHVVARIKAVVPRLGGSHRRIGYEITVRVAHHAFPDDAFLVAPGRVGQ